MTWQVWKHLVKKSACNIQCESFYHARWTDRQTDGWRAAGQSDKQLITQIQMFVIWIKKLLTPLFITTTILGFHWNCYGGLEMTSAALPSVSATMFQCPWTDYSNPAISLPHHFWASFKCLQQLCWVCQEATCVISHNKKPKRADWF